jgi:hypothetical protein
MLSEAEGGFRHASCSMAQIADRSLIAELLLWLP